MADRAGCFICTGCRIGESLDAPQLLKVAGEKKAVVAQCHEALCQPAGRALIEQAIAEHQLDAVVVAACSGRDLVRSFAFPEVYVDRANLREGVAWTHPAGAEDTQMLAEDVIRMALGKLRFVSQPKPQPFEVQHRVLVIGGGVAGLSAARAASAAGQQVVLVEKEDRLGGFANRLHKIFPKDFGVTAYPEPDLAGLIRAVETDDKITVHLASQVGRISGGPGAFEVTINTGAEKTNLKVDAVVVAAGFKPYDPSKLGHLGYGTSPNVVTNVEFEQMAKTGALDQQRGSPSATLRRPSDGKALESVLFIQCAGSRDDNHLPYCSNVCCGASMKQVTYLKEQNPGLATYVLYKDIRTPGHYEEVYKKVQKLGAVFVKGEVEAVTPGDGGQVTVRATDTLLGEPVVWEVDLVVLATGMVPTTLDTDVLNLQYRQGPELPEREYGFPNSHFVCFPYETQRTGIYAAGTVRTPMDLACSLDDGAGAAAKAVQAVRLVGAGAATHPRVGDLSLPDFALQRCTQCKRCTEECPFGTLEEDAKGTPQLNPTRCRRCGVCMGACPERIVSFANYNVQMISEQIKSIEVPDEFEEKPRILVLACENDAIPAFDLAAHNGVTLNPYFRVVPLRCLGSCNIVWIADAMSRGFDGVLLLGCKAGDDYQCHFIKGSALAETRMGNVKETLNRLQLEGERLRLEHVTITDYGRLAAILDDFAAKLAELGPNPYKG
jgi:quinone-modifying oxidoreductase subunit QmoB